MNGNFVLIISYLFNRLNKEVSFIKLHWLHSCETSCSHLYFLSFPFMMMYLYTLKMKFKTYSNSNNTLEDVKWISPIPNTYLPIQKSKLCLYSENNTSLWQTNSWIGDSLWNKVSAEFGLYAPKQSSSFLLVSNGHTTG